MVLPTFDIVLDVIPQFCNHLDVIVADVFATVVQSVNG